MKKLKIFLSITCLIGICLIMSACEGFERDYGDGTPVEKIGFWDKTKDVFTGKPIRKQKEKIALTGDEKKDIEIKKQNAEIEKFNEFAKKDNETPDEGLMPIVQWVFGAGGLGTIGMMLRKVNLQRKREEKVVVERDELRAGYQEIKETARGDNKKLQEIKGIFKQGVKNIQKAIKNKEVPEDIEQFKGIYNKVRKL